MIRTLMAVLVILPLLGAPAFGRTSPEDAFNDTLASGSEGCQRMINLLNVVTPTRTVTGGFVEPGQGGTLLIPWRMIANASKVCTIAIHGETSDPVASTIPTTVLSHACAYLKAYRKKSVPMETAQSSWACGWPSPVPGFRPVPGAF